MCGSEEHEPLDTGRILWASGGRCRLHRYLLDEHAKANAALGITRCKDWQQSHTIAFPGRVGTYSSTWRSQYSNGKLEVMRDQGMSLPLSGGYDEAGILITDPGAILQSRSGLPIGYWRGSGLALILDLLATLLSAGQSTHLIAKQESEYAVPQVFLAIEVTTLTGKELLKQTVGGIIRDFPSANPLSETEQLRYPGEDMMRTRKESLEFGVLVDENQ